MLHTHSLIAQERADALLARWHALKATHAHLHDPDAARLLGVPEAALFTARVGRGTTELTPDLPSILAPAEAWRRAFVVNRTAFGVAIHLLRAFQCRAAGTTLHIAAEEQSMVLDTARARRCFYVDDDGEHGRVIGLAWFDATGTCLGKLLLRSKIGQDEARPHILQHALPDQVADNPFHAQETVTSAADLHHGADSPGWTSVEPATAERSYIDLVLRYAEQGSGGCLGFTGPGIHSTYTGVLTKTAQDLPWLHASSDDIKLHLRPVQAVTALATTTADAITGIRLAGSDGTAISVERRDTQVAS